MNEPFVLAFEDQVHALVRSNPHGVWVEHVWLAFAKQNYLLPDGRTRHVRAIDVLVALASLGKKGLVECLDTEFPMHPQTPWRAMGIGEWTEFDAFVMEHLVD